MVWTVYILCCADETLYTGVTTDMPERLRKHAQGTGAKYTRGRGPYRVIHTEAHATRSEALRRELAIKKLTREQKLQLADA